MNPRPMRLRRACGLSVIAIIAGAMACAQDAGPGLSSEVIIREGMPIRSFSGPAYPPEAVIDPATGARIDYHGAFPNSGNPFRIDTRARFGAGRFAIETPARGMAGVLPGDDAPWLLNMIPFGLAIDGGILDPSGPWYDGGPADPRNPFDRACSGWEYEATHPIGAALVGIPDAIRGHVQPGGTFHYHGRPGAMIAAARAEAGNPAAAFVVGYSGDGFPVIDAFAADTKGRRVLLVSGYVLRQGARSPQPYTNPDLVPEGRYDGLYVQDYIYDPAAKRAEIDRAREAGALWQGVLIDAQTQIHILDPYNGLVLGADIPALPGYPAPHYVYAMTLDWPEIPRLFAFEPDASFKRLIPMEGPGMGGRIAARLGADVPQGRRTLYENCGDQAAAIRGLSGGRMPY